MLQESPQDKPEVKTNLKPFLTLVTLLPLPLCVLLEVLIGSAFWVIPNVGNAPGWILNVLEALCCAPYIASILLALIGELLFLTAWKNYRTVWTILLMWIDPVLIGIHILVISYLIYEVVYANPFTF